MVDHDRMHDMVLDAFLKTLSVATEIDLEEHNLDAKMFYEMLDAANQPIYEGCRESLSKMLLAARMMNTKIDHNLSKVCMDTWAKFFKSIIQNITCLLIFMRFRNWFIVLAYLQR